MNRATHSVICRFNRGGGPGSSSASSAFSPAVRAGYISLIAFAVAMSLTSMRGHAADAANAIVPITQPSVSRAAAVIVTATPLSVGVGAATWSFKVVLDTHSQDLKDDLLTSVVLVDADGGEVKPVAWDGAAAGGHHRQGVLQFKAPDRSPATIELVMRRPNESEPRRFTWAAP